MARARMCKPSFWTSEQVASCSRDARLLFIGLWNFCDDRGVHPASIRQLRMEVLPGDDDATICKVAEWMGQLVGSGLVRQFEHGGESFWHVTGWDRHQAINRPSVSSYPTPPKPENDRKRAKVEPNSRLTHGGLTEDSVSTHGGLTPKGKERKGKNKEEDYKTVIKSNLPDSRNTASKRKPKGNLGAFMQAEGLPVPDQSGGSRQVDAGLASHPSDTDVSPELLAANERLRQRQAEQDRLEAAS